MNLADTLHISSAGMQAQALRLRVVAENIANVDSTARHPGELPYRRQTITFQNILDSELGIEKVKVTERGHDMSDFEKKYAPYHPAADTGGYILMPNVSTIIETVDMKEARRGYEANLGVVEVAKAMLNRTLELLR